MNDKELKNPTIIIAVLQLLSLIVLYVAIACLVAFVASLIGYVMDLIPVFNPFHTFAKPSEGIFSTITPLAIISCLFAANSFIFKKYLFSIISIVIFFMLLAYLSIDLVIEQAQIYGIVSWEFANQIWFTLILCGTYLFFFVSRSDVLRYLSKSVDKEGGSS